MHIYLRRSLYGLALGFAAAAILVGYGMYASGFFARSAVYVTDAGALAGYDPVAYFTEGEAVKGLPENVTTYQGVSWRFANKEHMELFLQQPERYMPAYGGFCAYAMSEGYTAYSDPSVWRVIDGRLFLNYDRDVMTTWTQSSADRIAEADRIWQQRNSQGAVGERENG